MEDGRDETALWHMLSSDLDPRLVSSPRSSSARPRLRGCISWRASHHQHRMAHAAPLLPDEQLAQAAQAFASAVHLFVTAGAGMGVYSGLPDFRGPQGVRAG